MVSAGRVLIIPKGAYNPATTYEMLDLVSYNGSSYIAKTTTTGNLPTDTNYWQLSAYGGQAANIAGNFAEIETSSIATSVHYENDIFVDENSQLMKATQTINIGDTIDENTNCTPTTVEALINYLSSYVDSLDSLNKKIQGAIEIAAQTDLHSLAIGEYYKKQTSFYVTNAPTDIDQDPTAVFRLTIEAALDNASQANSPLLLTLRTLDGKIYTQSFDGTTWGSWEEIANESSVANVAAGLTTKQNITDNTLQTTSKTVPGAINELNTAIANEVATRIKVGGHNLLPNDMVSQTFRGVTFTKNSDGSVTANGTATEDIGFILTRIANLGISGNCILSGCTGGDSENTFALVITNEVNKEQAQETSEITVNMADYSSPTYPTSAVYILIRSGVTISNKTFYPMLRLATDANADYQPYAKTNQELTAENQTLTQKAYLTDDATETALASDDLVPFYDTSATAKKKMTVQNLIGQTVSNPNLLDNPWFTVNQRGQSSYNSTGYTVDRWYMGASAAGTKSVTVNSDETVTVANEASDSTVVYFFQRLDKAITDKLLNKMVTISVMLSDGTIFSASKAFAGVVFGNITVNGVALGGYRIWINSTTGVAELTVDVYAGKSISIKAIKLELGEVSTLASDTAPNYQQELAKCQRYFQMLSLPGTVNSAIGMGQARTTTKAEIHVPLACAMRTNTPTVAFSGAIKLRNADTVKDVTNVARECPGTNDFMLAMESTGLSAGAPYSCFIYQSGFISLSADL
jgi:hypothetical protein